MTDNFKSTFSRKTVLITGGAGYIASAMIKELCKVDCYIIRVGLPGSIFDQINGIAIIVDLEADITSLEFWTRHLENVDYVFHLAAYEHKHGAKFNPVLDVQVNTLSVLYLLEVCRTHKYNPFIIYASSSNVVGLPSHLPVNESFQDDPLIPFSIHKLTSEKYLRFYAREFGIKSVTLRLANVYGPVSNPSLCLRVVINKIVNLALNNGQLLLFQNSDCIRDYLWIDDAVAAFLAAAQFKKNLTYGQHFIIGNGTGYTIAKVWAMIADKIADRTGATILIENIISENLDAIEWRNFIADSSLFSKATGWQANISLDEGLNRTIDFILSRKQTYE